MIDPRAQDLLERIDELDAGEQAELDQLAGADPKVARLRARLASLDALGEEMQAALPAEPKLSDVARARVRRSRGPSPRVWWVAALLLIAAGVAGVWLAEPEFGVRGGPADMDGRLLVYGDGRLVPGVTRSRSEPVRFEVELGQAGHYALLELDPRTVLHPPVGETWALDAGAHVVQRDGVPSRYRAPREGEATYVLVGSPEPLPDLLADGLPEGVAELDRLTILWTP